MDKYTVRTSTGEVDVIASATAYATALTTWCATNEVASETIEAAVEAVFDRFPGQRLPMPALVDLAVTELSATPAAYKGLTERVHTYVTGQCAKNTGRLDIAKGVKGGVARLALPGEDVPARVTKTA